MRQQSTTSTNTDASAVYNKYIYLLMRQHSLQQVHVPTEALTVYKYIYLLMRQQSTTSTYTHWCVSSLQQVHTFIDASTQSTTSTYTYWCVNTVYYKYIYLPMCEHSLQQEQKCTYTHWCANTVYKYIYLLMRQHSLQQVHILTDASAPPPTSTYTYWSANSLQVHILTDASTAYYKYIYS